MRFDEIELCSRNWLTILSSSVATIGRAYVIRETETETETHREITLTSYQLCTSTPILKLDMTICVIHRHGWPGEAIPSSMRRSKLPTEFRVPTKGPHLIIGAAFQARLETNKCCKTRCPILLRSSEILIGKMQHGAPFQWGRTVLQVLHHQDISLSCSKKRSSSGKYNAPDWIMWVHLFASIGPVPRLKQKRTLSHNPGGSSCSLTQIKVWLRVQVCEFESCGECYCITPGLQYNKVTAAQVVSEN